jgi:HK97 family phage portal protein
MSTVEKIVIRDGNPARTWRDRIVGFVRSYWTGPITSNSPEIARLLGGGPVASGVTVNESTALGIAAFWCAVTTIAWDIASLPLFLYKSLPGGGNVRFESHPLNVLLHDQPNPETTRFQLWAALLINVLCGGNAFAEITRDSTGRPTGLWHIEPSRVSTFRTSDSVLRYRVQNASAPETIFEARDVLHLRGPSPDGLCGFDVVRIAREAEGLAIAAERFGAKFFANGSQLGGVLSAPGALTELAWKNLSERLIRQHQGSDNAHKWLLADHGLTFTPVGVNPRDSQFNELRTFQLREIARFFRIPVSYLGDLERATYSNFEQMQLQYFTSCIRPWLVNLENELNAKLISPSERQTLHCEHVVEGFLRADTEKRSAFYAVMVQNGLMTPNEIRALENLPPLPSGDVARVPLNTAPMGTASAGTRFLELRHKEDLHDDDPPAA